MLKKVGLGFGIFLIVLYAIFLISPIFLSNMLTSKCPEIIKFVEENYGFKVNIEKVKLITTPKLSVGLKMPHVEVALPSGEVFINVDNLQGELSLLPVLLRKIEIDKICAENINLNLKIKKDGRFYLEDFLPEEKSDNLEQSATNAGLPYGFKLSNNLPDIKIKNYNISFIDMLNDNSYSIYGDYFYITEFIFNQKIRVNTLGKVMFKDREQFSYDVNVLNKIMPDTDFNDFVFVQEAKEDSQSELVSFNILDIFKAIYHNHLTADLKSKIVINGSLENLSFSGFANISNFSMAVDGKKLPAGNLDLKMKGNKILLYSKLFTSVDELTELTGQFKTGKHPNIDLNCKSNAKFKSIIDLFDSVAKTFGYNQLDTLSATGGIDADFSIKSDLKSIVSSGYLKVPSASFSYKLYNILIDKVFADIQFADNTVNISDSGFSILGHPLRLKGKISSDAEADLSIIADKLQIKSLLLAAGQISLLKENNINSGDVSLNVLIKGKLQNVVPRISINMKNLNLKNIPSNTVISLLNSKVNLSTDGKTTGGNVNISSLKIANPLATVSVPNADIVLGDKDIEIKNAYALFNSSRIDISGKISDYLSKNLNINVLAKGNIYANDVKSLIPKDFRSEFLAKGVLPLQVAVTGNDKAQDIKVRVNANSSNYLSVMNIEQLRGKNTEIRTTVKLNGDKLKFEDTGLFIGNSSIASLSGSVSDLYKSQKLSLHVSVPSNLTMSIPFVGKSKMVAAGNIDVTGNALNPFLKGSVSIPLINIPDMLLTMKDMSISLNGPIAKGKGSLKSFVCGGIVADDLTSDFNLANNIFYLKNLVGKSFDGKINGNISYNILNGKTGVELTGTSMNAESAIAGAIGIKNALSGKLNFKTNVTTQGETDVKLIKNLKGSASFDISDGVLGNIGRFDNLLLAQNIMSNPVLKAGVTSIRSLPVIKDTANFKTINGNLRFQNGWADLVPIKTAGPSMAYYVTGKYNLLNGTANVVILGRISAEVVKLLGPLGDMSLSKLTSFIPGIGSATARIVQAITTSPYGEKVTEIPKLSSGNSNYKDFKVQFNGGVESSSSVKSFRWLSVCDTSEIESFKIKDQLEAAKNAMQEVKNKQIEAYNQQMAEQRKQAQEANQELKNAAEGLKNLFKSQTKMSVPSESPSGENVAPESKTPSESTKQ